MRSITLAVATSLLLSFSIGASSAQEVQQQETGITFDRMITSSTSKEFSLYLSLLQEELYALIKEGGDAIDSSIEWYYSVQSRTNAKRAEILALRYSNYYEVNSASRIRYIAESIDYLKNWFKYKGGTVEILEQQAHNYSLIINGLRSQIVPHEKFWEQIEIRAIAYDLPSGEVKFHLIVDGRYAAGIINTPAAEAYQDLEPRYSKNLDIFLKLMTRNIEDHLRNQQSSIKQDEPMNGRRKP